MANKLVILPKKHEEQKVVKIILADNYNLNKDMEQGVVILKSANVTDIEEGETVLYPKSAGIPLVWDNVTYALVNGPTKDSLGDIWLIV